MQGYQAPPPENKPTAASKPATWDLKPPQLGGGGEETRWATCQHPGPVVILEWPSAQVLPLGTCQGTQGMALLTFMGCQAPHSMHTSAALCGQRVPMAFRRLKCKRRTSVTSLLLCLSQETTVGPRSEGAACTHTPPRHPGRDWFLHGGIRVTRGQCSLQKQTRMGQDRQGETAGTGCSGF